MLAGGSMILAALSVYFVKDGVEEKIENNQSEVAA
jgi:maltose/moltooligosaccharide transporter